MPKAAYHTVGCKVNQYETEKIREELESLGFSTVSFTSAAEVYVINSCSVTAAAESDSRRAIRRAARLNPKALIVATGCCAELDPASMAEIDGVDLVVGNEEKHSIPERVLGRFPDVRPNGSHPVRPRLRTRAVVKVQDGCSQFCAYCAVPYARGKRYSRPLAEVVEEVRALADFGYREIVLTGIRLGSYGAGLPELVRVAAEVEGIERIRLSSIEVWEIGDELIQVMAENPRVCRHLHVPLQSGDAEVLRLMHRPYSPEDYAETVEKVRSAMPGLGLTTDVMVGFPGESLDGFERSYSFVERMGFSRLHVFRYSPRPGTAAAAFAGQVPEIEKSRRSERMIELGGRLSRRSAEQLIGRTVPVLVERRRGELLHGFTDNYVEVQFAGSDRLRGRIMPVRVNEVTEGGAFGCIPCEKEGSGE